MTEHELFERALGVDEPPVTLDFEAIEAVGARAVRRRSKLALGGAAAAVVLAVGGIIAAMSHSAALTTPAHGIRYAAPTDRSGAYCYRTADIGSVATNQHVLFGISDGDAASGAMEICRSAWTDDVYQWIPDGQPRIAPPLIACVLDSRAAKAMTGMVAVFPGTAQTCAELRLAVAKI
ncbi:MAG: hypothetical protein JWQ81_5437 [Amycolatopsis sp.]|jgi:hypothetical protein|uniref:hypothetical protein n=1 Tax=Amycolatopsis sp. TaxID=37632 RepID=UPI00260A4895|nr:hypothetical protein [Amycolatopsis sp.]MCU1684698.1 hypothetical protein [Amycolatopsis sp.]